MKLPKSKAVIVISVQAKCVAVLVTVHTHSFVVAAIIFTYTLEIRHVCHCEKVLLS